MTPETDLRSDVQQEGWVVEVRMLWEKLGTERDVPIGSVQRDERVESRGQGERSRWNMLEGRVS